MAQMQADTFDQMGYLSSVAPGASSGAPGAPAPVSVPAAPAPATSSSEFDQMSYLSSVAPNAGGAPATAPTQAPAAASSAPAPTGLAREADLAARGFLGGLGSAISLPGDALRFGVDKLLNPLVRLTGANPPSYDQVVSSLPPDQVTLPTSGAVAGMVNSLGLPQVSPEGLPERLLSGAASGLGGALPFGPGALLPGLAGGMASEAAQDVTGDNPLVGLAAGALGGLGAGGLQSALAGSSLAKEARSLGSSETLQSAGTALQSSAQDWLANKFPAAEDAVWTPVDQALHSEAAPKGPSVPLSGFQQSLQSIAGKGGQLSGLADKMQPALGKQLLDQLTASATQAPGPGKFLGAGAAAPPTATWDDVRQIRSLIGAGMKDSKSPLQSIGQANLDKMYAGITQDLQGAADTAGAGDLFANANAESSRLRQLADKTIGPLASEPVPEKAAKQLLSGGAAGGTNLQTLRNELGPAVGELASAHLLQTPQGWSKLAPEAKAALVPDANQRTRIDSAVAASAGKPVGNPVASLLRSEIAGQVGERAVNSLAGAFGLAHSGLLGYGIGLAAPAVARGGVNLLSNPSGLRAPLVGALAGGNQLLGSAPPSAAPPGP